MNDLLLLSFLAALAVAAVVAAIVLVARNRALRQQAAERARKARASARPPRAAAAASAAAPTPSVTRSSAARPTIAPAERLTAAPSPVANAGSPRFAPPPAEPAPPRSVARPAATRPAAPPPRPPVRPDFEVTRPFEPAIDSALPATRAPIAAPAPAAARRILVVDDSAVVRAKLGKLLAARGWTVALARHGGQALEVLDREGADLLITDLEMPEMDGHALIAALASRSLPILAITGHETPPAPAQLGRSVRGVMRKPWDDADLLAAVDAALRPSTTLLVH